LALGGFSVVLYIELYNIATRALAWRWSRFYFNGDGMPHTPPGRAGGDAFTGGVMSVMTRGYEAISNPPGAPILAFKTPMAR
jgi:hypothetical protein